MLQPSSSPLSHYEFDVLISAGGGKFVPEGFKRKETRGKVAIGITTNFVNRHSRAEVEVSEISGVARIYNQKFFQNLYNKTGRWAPSGDGGPGGSHLSPGAPRMSPLGWDACPRTVPPCRGRLVAPRGSAQPLSRCQVSTWKTSSTTRTTPTTSS